VCPCHDGTKAPAAATPSARQPTACRGLVRASRSDASASQWRSAGTRPCVPSRVGVWLPQVDARYTRKVPRGAGGLPLYVGMGECIPRDGEACVGHLHVMDAGGMLRGWESMENLGMMPRQASPRPPWRVAPAWRGSSGFERCVHDADHSPEVCRLSPASPCSRLAFLPTKLHISSSSELSPRRASSSSARHISTSTCSAGTCAKSA
jgi:hypothetical protein